VLYASEVRKKPFPKSKIMTQHFLPLIDTPLEQKFLKAVISYYLHENDKLGLGLSESQIGAVCRILLCGSEPNPDNPQTWQIHEETILEEYHKKEFAIMDYLHVVSLELRKQLGQYSTPIEIVRYIIKSVDYIPSKSILPKKLIDPACGSGAFLGEACRVYLNALKKATIPMSEWYPMIVSAINGIDIDPKACFFARLNLAMLLAPPILEFVSRNTIAELQPLPVYCADTLHLLASRRKGIPLFYDRFNIPLEGQFDFVVGNPPYYKIKNLEQNIKDTFTESIYGHPNAYALFIHAGIEMLRTHGRLGFIVPRSMLSGLYFKNLREFIERKTAIKEIVNISDRKSIFEDVLHGTMILSLKRDKQNDKKINISLMKTLEDIRDQHRAIVVDRNKVVQRLNGTTVWFVADSLDVYNILSKIIKGSPLLSGQEVNYRAKTGQIVWNRVKPLLSIQREPDTLPLVWATDVGKFSFSFNRMGTARPCFLRLNAKTKNLAVEGPCILVQRITADEQPSRIIACIPEEFCKKERNGYFVENHLNIVQPTVKNRTIDLYFILGILNSEVVEFFFRAMNGNTQVSVTDLNRLPIPLGKYEKDIAHFTKIIKKINRREKRVNLLKKLNQLVVVAYGLKEKEHEFIKKFLGKNSC
jgi:adenine-specific DNA-methyltransferase